MTTEVNTADDGVIEADTVLPLESIPLWDNTGVIPPIRPGAAGHDLDRSPYEATMAAVVQLFGTTSARREILRGLIQLRASLHSVGIVEGFQWLDGSFFEHVENTRGRPPNDIDVVTFAVLGDESEQQALAARAPELFDHPSVKTAYKVDHYYVDLGQTMNRESVRWTGYWYSMWSHRRDDHLWKGFVEIDLNISGDSAALEELERLDMPRGHT